MKHTASCGAIGFFALGLTLVLTASSPQSNPPYPAVVVFGDSLSCDGRSDGPHWAAQTASKIGAFDTSIQAARNATTTDVYEGQVKPYLAAREREVSADALYIVWAGANDLFRIKSCKESEAVIRNGVEQISKSIEALVRCGARHVLAPNLPDLGRVPAMLMAGPDASRLATRRARAFNRALATKLAELRRSHGIELFAPDVFAAHREWLATPAKFGLENVTHSAKATCEPGGDMSGYLYWDAVHPTSTGHSLLSDTALKALGLARLQDGKNTRCTIE